MAIETAKHLTVSMRRQLETENGVMGLQQQRTVQITAAAVDSAERAFFPSDDDESSRTTTTTTTKLIHFQRHGQGFHNVICEMWRELGKPVDLSSQDPTLNPMKRLEVKDSPLTEVGRQQCLARHEQASLLNPEIVVTTSQIQSVYPTVDFSLLASEEDTLFMAERHETALEKADRVYEFLLYLRNLPQKEIAVVTHSAWLFHMCNAVMEIPDESLSSWFLTSEIRSMRVSFVDRHQEDGTTTRD
eukprot:scaffold2363_cov159-Amphora_coffeaeformis.AAC.37